MAHGLKFTLSEGETAMMGMNGWQFSLNEWPTQNMLPLIGGTISSITLIKLIPGPARLMLLLVRFMKFVADRFFSSCSIGVLSILIAKNYSCWKK